MTGRYDGLAPRKTAGATYTPPELADFVAGEMLRSWRDAGPAPLRILDPAVGEGQLLGSLLARLPDRPVDVHGFDSDPDALARAADRLRGLHPNATLQLHAGDFLALAPDAAQAGRAEPPRGPADGFDLVIANPPYVRTQIIGAEAARALAERFGLTGRVDLQHAFILAIAQALRPHGVTGLIVSNRFMTTRAGAAVRRALQERLHLRRVWDLGDTKLFDAAVLPAVVIAGGLHGSRPDAAAFTSIYQTTDDAATEARSISAAATQDGVVRIPDGRRFRVVRGTLDDGDGVWRLATGARDAWLDAVARRTWGTFRRLGRIRVGVKTCADRVFIRDDWEALPPGDRPELLRPVTTHHVARRFRADVGGARRRIVYPHEWALGERRAVDLTGRPRTKRYLEAHRDRLERRSYLRQAGRRWYELWVPHDPRLWARPKLVLRDISAAPCFWIDQDGTIVNGDCYWLVCDDPAQEELLWLAAGVGNSTFIEAFYDRRFNNKLYAGRRRFITQYVEQFPLPDPETDAARSIIEAAKSIYDGIGTPAAAASAGRLDALVWEAFDVPTDDDRPRPDRAI